MQYTIIVRQTSIVIDLMSVPLTLKSGKRQPFCFHICLMTLVTCIAVSLLRSLYLLKRIPYLLVSGDTCIAAFLRPTERLSRCMSSQSRPLWIRVLLSSRDAHKAIVDKSVMALSKA